MDLYQSRVHEQGPECRTYASPNSSAGTSHDNHLAFHGQFWPGGINGGIHILVDVLGEASVLEEEVVWQLVHTGLLCRDLDQSDPDVTYVDQNLSLSDTKSNR